ncbi:MULTISPECIES: HAD domain-containing protein [unclassified Streptomyces]|uniref:HAD domain-containing protein n=1 Tax=unclassified Streptomyces TaxID=2593676 RepID=UPI0033AC9FEF
MKPLLLIDIDGPLNPFAALAHRPVPEGYALHRMRPTGWKTGAPLPVLLSAEHGEELLTLSARYELVWATTWKDEANEWVGPRLGLPPLPYIDWPSMHGTPADGTYWKTRHVVDHADGRPFAWVDDEISGIDRDWVAAHHPGHALLLRVDPGVGLSRTDFDALAEWEG